MNKGFLRRLIKPLGWEQRQKLIEEIRPMASPGFDFFFLVVLSCAIATLGLTTNSPAVIIGAMLIAPLMSPIIGLGLASVIGDTYLFRSSLSALLRGAVLAVVLAVIVTRITLFIPVLLAQTLPEEIMARTHPTLIDLAIALAGGLAAAYALTKPNLSATLPGVAIATALMPPLCTIGIGLALGRMDVTLGAVLLFLTNAVTIAFAAVLVFFLRGFGAISFKGEPRLPRSLLLSAGLILVLFIPLNVFGVQIFQEAAEDRRAQVAVAEQLERIPGTDLLDLSMNRQGAELEMEITISTSKLLRYDQVVQLQEDIVSALDRPAAIRVNQVFAEQLDPLVPPTQTSTPTLTPTNTPGPSPTATFTITPSATATAMPTETRTPTATPLPTDTPTPTRTPHPASIAATGLPRLQIVQYPGGPVIGTLRPGQRITVLYGERIADGLVWVEVEDEEGRVGWVPQIYIRALAPATATPTP